MTQTYYAIVDKRTQKIAKKSRKSNKRPFIYFKEKSANDTLKSTYSIEERVNYGVVEVEVSYENSYTDR
jgi:hypothetical protein